MPENRPSVATIVLAGGSGTRLGLSGGANKVYLPLDGRPLLAWSLRALYSALQPAFGVLVIRAGDEAEAASAIAAAGITPPQVAVGGGTRTQSECAGVAALRTPIDSGEIDVVLVHDGARPFPTGPMLSRLVAAARDHGAAVPALRPAGTLLEQGDDGQLRPVDSDRIRTVQTPQAIRAQELLAAVDAAGVSGAEAVDTVSLVALAGGPVAVAVEGDTDNLKVTRPEDVEAATRIARSTERWVVASGAVPSPSEP